MRSSEDQRIGQILLGKLRVVRRLGEGGTATVYEVEHLRTGHRRALKVLHPRAARSRVVAARFEREATVASRLKTPYVVETLDAGTLDDGSPYVLMELVEGVSLAAILGDSAALPWARALGILIEAATAIAIAHEHGIVHGDLKPENIFVVRRADGTETIKLLDFGASRFASPGANGVASDRSGFGTPAYMSPEQVQDAADIDERTDVYALGVILYEMLSGELPFVGATQSQLGMRILVGNHRTLSRVVPGIHPELEEIVERALHHRRERRFRSARELAQALREASPVCYGPPAPRSSLSPSAIDSTVPLTTSLLTPSFRKGAGPISARRFGWKRAQGIAIGGFLVAAVGVALSSRQLQGSASGAAPGFDPPEPVGAVEPGDGIPSPGCESAGRPPAESCPGAQAHPESMSGIASAPRGACPSPSTSASPPPPLPVEGRLRVP